MPIEIREVVIKANLEKSFSHKDSDEVVKEEQIRDLKEQIMAELMEQITEKLWLKKER